MNISDLTLRLLLIFIPGIITTLMIDLLTVHRKWEFYKFSLYSLLSGLVSYLLLQSVFSLVFIVAPSCFVSSTLNIWSTLADKRDLPFVEIGAACIISLVLGFGASALIERKLLGKIASKLGVTLKYGEESLFNNFLKRADVSTVYVHDRKYQRIYHGYVIGYSEDDKIHEILLCDVDIYSTENPEAELLYNCPKLYICKAIDDDLNIEVPTITEK